MDTLEAIRERRSVRKFRQDPVERELLDQLVDSGRLAPTAMGKEPWEFVVVTEDDMRARIAGTTDYGKFIAEAPCVFVISANFERTTRRYEDRGAMRYVPMDTGHAAENLLLQAIALGLAGVPVGAFVDDAVHKVLALPKQEVPLYILPVGHPR